MRDSEFDNIIYFTVFSRDMINNRNCVIDNAIESHQCYCNYIEMTFVSVV